ncbi:MAG: aspartate/glutamate racemase family protein [Pirellulales bacterium]|nr:aspartate/glutamate racemase family protein [Pirellulales bacterium]
MKVIKVLQLKDSEQKYVRDVIEDVKQNRVNRKTHEKLRTMICNLENQGADTIILGCTELPMAMAGVSTDCAIVDSMAVLAQSVVRQAKASTMPTEDRRPT